MFRKQLCLAAAAACLSVSAHARCSTTDSWTSPDKAKHVAMGAAIGAAGTLYFKEPWKGFLLGAAAGVALEAASAASGKGTCSFQDAAMTALGAAAGAYGTAWIITPRFVGFSARF